MRARVHGQGAVEQHPFTSLELFQQAEPYQSAKEKSWTANTNLGDSPPGPVQPGAGAPARDGWVSALVFPLPGAGRSPGLAQLDGSATWGSVGHHLGLAWHPKAVRTSVKL